MLRVNVGLSRKLSKDYNSTGYSINVDGEVTAAVSDPEAVIERVKELFDLAEESLDLQIRRAEGDAAFAQRDGQHEQRRPPRRPANAGNGQAARTSPKQNEHRNGDERGAEPATDKQLQFLLTIAKRQRLSAIDLERQIGDVLGRETGLYDLTKQEAAKAIDALNGHRQQASSETANGNGRR
ncbi:MAG TPA: hypothetical protein VG944_14675 [Fimbriimonas sp.]|nr:hypothetical protein [Fimbriimonas sp.]